MSYKTLIISTLLLVLNLSIYSQQTVKFNGPFNNGLGIPATATYSYYVNTTLKKEVKHGNFRYTVREKDQNSRYSQSFSGSYEHGLKNGPWEYQINIKDFKKSSEDYYHTADIHLIANYVKGVPDGNWTYTANISKRGKYKAGKDDKWDAPIPIKNISIELKFNKGKVCDSLKITNNMGNSYLFLMNSNGMLDGVCEINQNGQLKLIEYVTGFEKSTKINSENEVLNPYYTLYQNAKNKKNNAFKMDTLSFFDQADYTIGAILNDNIFNNEYFLFEKIEGDKSLTDEKGRYKPYKFNGLNYISLVNQLPANEMAYVQKIKSIDREIADKLEKCRIEIKKAKDKTELQKTETRLKIIQDESKRNICYTGYIQSSILLDEAILQASAKCGDIKIDTKGLSREAYLIKLYNRQSELKNQLIALKI